MACCKAGQEYVKCSTNMQMPQIISANYSIENGIINISCFLYHFSYSSSSLLMYLLLKVGLRVRLPKF